MFLTTKVNLGPGEKDSSSVLDNFQTEGVEAPPLTSEKLPPIREDLQEIIVLLIIKQFSCATPEKHLVPCIKWPVFLGLGKGMLGHTIRM